jgi:hypothetical protein
VALWPIFCSIVAESKSKARESRSGRRETGSVARRPREWKGFLWIQGCQVNGESREILIILSIHLVPV